MRSHRRLAALIVLSVCLAALIGCTKQPPKEPPPVPPMEPPKTTTGPGTTTPAATTAEVSGELQALVPCGVAGPYQELETLFLQQHPAVTLKPPVAKNITELVDMAIKGAPGDVLMTMGDQEMAKVEQAGQLLAGTRAGVAQNALGLLVPAEGVKVTTWEDLGKDPLPTVGLADPETNSSGYYTREALQKAGYWDKLEQARKIVVAPQPSDLQPWVAGKKVDVALIYEPCAHEVAKGTEKPQPKPSPKKAKLIGKVPQDLYPTFYFSAAVLKGTKNEAAARAFVQFLSSPEATVIWEKWSFGKPEAGGAATP